jgi:hypothetical protein
MTQDDTCLDYGKGGHWAKDCHLPPCRGGQSHVAQAEEEEVALFLVHRCIELQPETREGEKSSNFSFRALAGSSLLHLNELRAHAFLGNCTVNDKIGGWYLNTGATHHMTRQREFFSDLDSSMRGSIKFGVASTVEIKGVGFVIFKAKIGEHRLLTGMYYILALRNSIISIGQLDKNGSWVEIDGVLCI